ncbi:unnamed protein product [Pelagomonas calceolata]|uniref:MYND-type domain-containing protein n=1 Tax=Pelagomonas calceolata TaxID=35677 RepID=A0A8J2S7G4_9STRA|nr:unnamed protein product [Pelagomonas calceolata]
MILTTCAACAAPLAHNAPRCVRCHTRYCNQTCQHDHWRRGHKQMCKKIHRGGNAEQYHADKKYKEAVAEAVEKCADDTKGQTCFICTQALHWKTKEGLVRGCSCRGTAGFAHVSCLAEQAKILVAEAEENNWDNDRFMPRWNRWHTCSLCKQQYHGVVRRALGWASWKTYLGRPETSWPRMCSLSLLGNGLAGADLYEEALSVQEAELSVLRRLGEAEYNILVAQGNLANTYQELGRLEEALPLRRDVYSGWVKIEGEEHRETLREANNYASLLKRLKHFGEAKSLLRKTTRVALRSLGEDHDTTFKSRWIYARVLCEDPAATLDDLRESVTTLEEIEPIARRVLGGAHPTALSIEATLRIVRGMLQCLRDAVERSG